MQSDKLEVSAAGFRRRLPFTVPRLCNLMFGADSLQHITYHDESGLGNGYYHTAGARPCRRSHGEYTSVQSGLKW